MPLSNLANDIAKKLNRHAPAILTGLSLVGVAATATLFVRAGMLAEREIQHEMRVNEEYDERVPTFVEKVGHTWHHYLIPTSIGVATVVCIICTNSLNHKRQASLIGAYALAERGFSQYREKVQEMVGEHGESSIRHEATKDMAADRTPSKQMHVDGEVIFLDVFSGQMFSSTEENVHKAMNEVNQKAEEDGFVTLNYFYDRLGARTTQLGEIFGWSDGIPLEVILTAVQFEDGTHGFGLDYVRYPFGGYHEV